MEQQTGTLGCGAAKWLWVIAVAIAAGGLVLWQGHVRAKAAPTAAVEQPRPAAEAYVAAASQVEAGRYIVKLGGGNDCHTPMFAMKDGKVPESEWLTGDMVGFRGPWGTSYPSNLRLFVQSFKEDDFVQMTRNRNSRPPMPWPSLHAMSDKDLRAVYAYIKALGPAGKPAPEYVPPTEEPKTPYLNFVPVFPMGFPAPSADAK